MLIFLRFMVGLYSSAVYRSKNECLSYNIVYATAAIIYNFSNQYMFLSFVDIGKFQLNCKANSGRGMRYYCQARRAVGWCRNRWDSPEDGGGFKRTYIWEKNSGGNGWRLVWTLSPIQKIPPRSSHWASRIRDFEKHSDRTFQRWLWNWCCSFGCY